MKRRQEGEDLAPALISPEPGLALEKFSKQRSRDGSGSENEKDPTEPLYREFETLNDFDQKADFVLRATHESAFDCDVALEMTEILFQEALKQGRARRFLEVADNLCEANPELISEGSQYFYHWRVSAALLDGQRERAATLFLEAATNNSAKEIDAFGWTVEKMAYHGELKPLFEGLRQAWPDIEASDDVLPWAKSEYFNTVIECAVFDYLEDLAPQNLALASDVDPQLKARIAPWGSEINGDVLRSQVSLLSEKQAGNWNVEDFRGVKSDSLLYLSWEFLAYLRWHDGIPFTRASMQRDRIYEYLSKRLKQKLVQQPSLWEQLNQPQRKQQRQKPPSHPLCPDRKTLDIYLGQQINLISPDLFRIATTAEAIPRWLAFLSNRNLVSSEMGFKAANELQPLLSEVRDLLDKSGEGIFFMKDTTRALAC
jgi:hypothetical protein